MPELRPDVVIERLSLMTMFILRAVADRRAPAVADRGRPQLEHEEFVQNLLAMAAGAVASPTGSGVPVTRSPRRR